MYQSVMKSELMKNLHLNVKQIAEGGTCRFTVLNLESVGKC